MTSNFKDRHRVLAVNTGSSSVKCALFTAMDPPSRTVSGEVDRIGTPNSGMTIIDGAQRKQTYVIDGSDRIAAVFAMIDRLVASDSGTPIGAVGHRVSHGGSLYREHRHITPELMTELHRLSPLAPEHLPAQIAIIQGMAARYPMLPQTVCFDTAFHADMPTVARTIPVPRRLERLGIKRYGFHGISCQYLIEELGRAAGVDAARGRIILAHLGNGASMTAVRNGRSIDTSMGFTPTAGFPMSTRSGDLDPGLIWFLKESEGMTLDQFHEMINCQSGLLGVSETSSDMRELLAMQAHDHRAAEAVELFCYQVKKWIGGFTAALGGLDTLVFSGGIGEKSSEVRARICENLEYLGIRLDQTRNVAGAPVISTDGSPVAVRVMHSDEELVIARSVLQLLSQASSSRAIQGEGEGE